MNTDPLGHATTRGVNGYGVPTVTGFADLTSVTTTPSGQTAVDESDRFPDLSLDEANRPRDWTYDPTGVLTGATDLGGNIQWDLSSGEVTLGHAEGRPGADTYTGSHPDRPEVPALEGESWRRPLRTFTSPEGEVTPTAYCADAALRRLFKRRVGRIHDSYGPAGMAVTYGAAHATLVFVLKHLKRWQKGPRD